MPIDRKKFEWNLNTLLSLFTLASVIVSGVAFWVNQTRDIEEIKKWQDDHDKVVEERLIENRTLRGQTEARIKAVEEAAVKSDRTQDQIAYRVTVVETSLATQQQQQQKTAEDVSEIKGDLKVVKEILLRQDAANKRAVR